MANWKKVIVSGSIANLAGLQVDGLTNDQVVIGGGSGSLLTSTPINGTGNIVATEGASGLSHSGSFSGSFQGDGSGLTGVIANNAFALSQSAGITPFSYNGSSTQTVEVSGASTLVTDKITKWNGNAFATSSLLDNGTTISGTTSLQLSGANSSLTGSFTGSFVGDGSGLTGLVNSLNISGSTGNGSVDLLNQTLSILGTTNQITTVASGQSVTISLPNNLTVPSNLIVPGDLVVNGTASFQSTENLLVADRFVLFASGSITTGDGGIVIQQGTQNVGELFGYENTANRWAITSSYNAASSSFTPSEYMVTAKAASGTPTGNPTYGGAATGYGNIYVDSATEDIYIWA
jgi:hypothetical protein